MQNYDIFLSYKHFDYNGELTTDAVLAKKLYNSLTRIGISVFFSEDSIFEIGISDYKKVIDDALDNTSLLVVIASNAEFLKSGWVEYEYETYYEDILSGKKTGMIVSYTDNIYQNQLPRTLSRFQNYSQSKTSIEKIVSFLTNSIKNIESANNNSLCSNQKRVSSKQTCFTDSLGNPDKPHKSSYSSDYYNEFKRLELQAKNCAYADETALNYLFSQNEWKEEKDLFVLDAGSAYGYVAADRFCPYSKVKKILCVDNNPRVIERAQIRFADNPRMIFEELDLESDSMVEDIERIMAKHNIPYINIVYSALTLHHLKNPNKVLRNLRRIMIPNSYIILRGSDDGSKLCYPKSNLLDSILKKTTEAEGVSDRQNGRKIFSQLKNAGFLDIKIFSCMRDTSCIPYDSLNELFQESFSYRVNYFQKAIEMNPEDKKAKEDYEWMKNALEEFENLFYRSDFWYCQYYYVGIGHKQK